MHEKRAFERSGSSIIMNFCCNDTTYSGRVINLSKKGICINTVECFLPCAFKIKLIIPLLRKTMTLHSRIRRIVKIDDLNYTLGVELLNPPNDYLEFVENYKNTKI